MDNRIFENKNPYTKDSTKKGDSIDIHGPKFSTVIVRFMTATVRFPA